MFWKKQWKKLLKKDGREEYEIPAYSKDGGHIKSLERQGGLTTSASYGGMGVRELQLRMELLVEPVLSAQNSVFEAAKQLASFAKVDQDRFLNSVDELCNTDIELALNFCQFAPNSLQLVDEEQWNEWIIHVRDIYKLKGLKDSIDAICNVEQYIQSLSHAPNGVALADVSRVLESFVTGLSGRYLSVEISDEIFTDTESIRLPEVSTIFNKKEDNFTVYKAMLVHQWAQTWFGTWRLDIEAVANRFKDPERALSIFHKLETIRLDACIHNELPGIARAIQVLDEEQKTQHLSKNWQRAYKKLAKPNATVRDTMFFLEAVYKDELMPDDKFYQGSLNPNAVRMVMEARAKKEKASLRDQLTRLQQELEKVRGENTKNETGEASNDAIAEDGMKGFTVNEIKDDTLPDGFKIELQYDDDAIQLPEEIQELLASILQDFGEIPDDYLDTDYVASENDSQNDEDQDSIPH